VHPGVQEDDCYADNATFEIILDYIQSDYIKLTQQ